MESLRDIAEQSYISRLMTQGFGPKSLSEEDFSRLSRNTLGTLKVEAFGMTFEFVYKPWGLFMPIIAVFKGFKTIRALPTLQVFRDFEAIFPKATFQIGTSTLKILVPVKKPQDNPNETYKLKISFSIVPSKLLGIVTHYRSCSQSGLV